VFFNDVKHPKYQQSLLLVDVTPENDLLGSHHTVKNVTTPNETTLLWANQVTK